MINRAKNSKAVQQVSLRERKLKFIEGVLGRLNDYADTVSINGVKVATPEGYKEPLAHLKILESNGDTAYFRPKGRTVRFEKGNDSLSVFFSKYGPLAVFRRKSKGKEYKIKVSPLRDFPETHLNDEIIEPTAKFSKKLFGKVIDSMSPYKRIDK